MVSLEPGHEASEIPEVSPQSAGCHTRLAGGFDMRTASLLAVVGKVLEVQLLDPIGGDALGRR